MSNAIEIDHNEGGFAMTRALARLATTLALLGSTLPAAARAQDTERISVDSKEKEANGASGNGRQPATTGGEKALVVFQSSATNLVANDTNGKSDLFLRDLGLGTTTRIVFDVNGNETDGNSSGGSITPDGRFVVFQSAATLLVSGDKNGVDDIFVLDRSKGTIERVSVDSSGKEADGRSFSAAISADGNFVAFVSLADNLVANDGNAIFDVFLRDRAAGTTTCLSVDPTGVPGNKLSSEAWMTADGSKVAFSSDASNLVANDTNGLSDVFVRDVAAGVTTRASVNEGGFELDGKSASPSLSADGSLVAFASEATNLHRDSPTRSFQAYVRDLATGEVWLATRGVDGRPCIGTLFNPEITSDPRTGEPIVVFWSTATNLPDDGIADFDLFAVRPWSGISQCLSVDSDGVDTDNSAGGSFSSSGVPPDGGAMYLCTSIPGLDPNDTNGASDVFRRGLQWTLPSEFGTGLGGSGGYVPHLSARGGSCEAGRWFVEIADGLPLAPGHLWVGFGRTNGIKLFGGTFYLDFTQQVIPLPIQLQGPAGVFGAGTLHLDGANVEDLGQFSIFLQCTFLDANAPRGVSLSNALEIVIDAN
jgi:hypothetical protein